MASTQQLRRRIGSVKNTRQITKAMEMVSASKLRRAQDASAAGQDFARIASQLLTRIRQLTDVSKHPLYARRQVKSRLIILVASDRGLAGAYNSAVLKHFASELASDRENGIKHQIVTVGKQATNFCAKVDDLTVVRAYHGFADSPSTENTRSILDFINEAFLNREFDAVDIIYTDFISSINQKPSTSRLLPVAFEDVALPVGLDEAAFEPSPIEVLNGITRRFVEVNLNQHLLEAAASEHASRMMAMKNATDNASDIVDGLTLALNTARQAAITQELAEITAGAEAIS